MIAYKYRSGRGIKDKNGGTVVLECKDGAWEVVKEEDLLRE